MNGLDWLLGVARILAGLAIGYGLLWAYRWIRRQSPVLGAVVAAGFLLRAGLGQLLFWVSYLDLPLWRHLHLGNGFWQVAPDAEFYVLAGSRAVEQGLSTIEPGSASPTYVTLLSIWMHIVGSAPASGMFLNLTAYTGLCLLVVYVWRPRGAWRDDLPCVVLLGSFTLSPVLLIHGTQPLKDEVFAVLAAAACVGAWLLLRSLLQGPVTRESFPGALLGFGVLLLALFVMAGIRTYYVFILWGCLTAVLVFFAVRRSVERLRRKLPSAIVVSTATWFACVLGAGPYAEEAVSLVRGLIRVSPAATDEDEAVGPSAVARKLAEWIESRRTGFENAGGATNIVHLHSDEPPAPARAPDAPAAPEASRPAVAMPPADVTAQAASSPSTQTPPPPSADATDATQSAAPTPPPVASVPPPVPTPSATPPSPATVPVTQAPASPPALPVVPSPAIAPSPSPPITPALQPRRAGYLKRVAVGLATIFVPISLLKALSVVEFPGGRGLLVLTDIDTLYLYATIAAAFVVLYRRRLQTGPHLPYLGFALLSVGVTAVLLGYVVTNFGTLYRLRLLVSVPVWMLVLAGARGRFSDEGLHEATRSSTNVEREPERSVPATPVRVLRVIARLNVGGPARHATVLDDRLRVLGFDPLLVHGSVGSAEGSLEDQIAARGLRSEKIPGLGRRIRLWSDLWALCLLTRLMFRERPDVVHTHTAKAGVLGRLAAWLYNRTRAPARRCVVIHTFHGHVFSGYFGPVATAAARGVERGMARLSDRIVTISRSQKSDISERYRVAPPWKTAVVELGIELEPLLGLEANGARRAGHEMAPDDVVFGYVGRFVAIKDLSTLIRAFAVTAGRVPNARLMLVGDGELRAPLRRLVVELQLGGRVLFTGWRRDLPAVYAAMDVGVLSSLNEGTPVALIEAMAAGRPVIATAVGGVGDVVRHGRTGLVVPPRDVARLAEAMTTLARDRALRQRLGEAGRRAIADRFSPRRLAAEISDLYLRALVEKRGLAPTHEWARRIKPAPISVLTVIARLNIGGPADHVATLSRELRARGCEPLVVHGSVGPTEGSLEDVIFAEELRAVKIPELGRRIRPWSDLRALHGLTRLMFRERPDVVHTHTAKAGTLGRLAALVYNASRPRARRCVVIHTFHGHVFSGYFGPLATAAARLVERGMALISDRVVTISASQKHDICERYRVAPAAKTDVIELGIDLVALLRLQTDTTLREELQFSAFAVVYGYVGRFVAIKDLPTLIRAFAVAVKRAPYARLMLVGDGEVRLGLEALVRELGLGDRVAFTGWRRDLAAVYGAIDVGVLSSLNEGTPVALIEAMAAGRPVIATAVGGVQDVVDDDGTGLVVPPRDPARLAEAIVRLAEDADLRRRLGRTGRKQIADRFGAERMADEVIALYTSALRERRGVDGLY